MKIAICGKGGCGKSTTAALLGKQFARMHQSVLIVDSDESNFGLHRQLGMELPKDFTAYFGGKEQIMNDLRLARFTEKFFQHQWHISDIPAGYCTEKNGIRLMAAGKIHLANEGCACPMGKVIGQFIASLTLDANEVAIMDMEAGIEHFGRGIDGGVDVVLMVVDPSYESLKLSGKVLELGRSIEKPVFFVLNKLTDDNRTVMLENIADPSKVLCELPAEADILSAGLCGQELTVELECIEKAAEALLKLA